MITIISIVCFFTFFYWLRKWDKALKRRVSIREFLPKEDEPIQLLFVAAPTVLTIGTIIYLMITYLP